jgi:acetoacetyl-CoA reductase
MARVALVTGGTRGIGAAISKALKAAGYKVAASYAGNDAAADKFKTETGIPVYKWDVSSFDACADGVKKVEADLGPVDVLINNAGITKDGAFHKMTLEQWNAVINTNLGSLFNMTRQVIEACAPEKSAASSTSPRSTARRVSSARSTIPRRRPGISASPRRSRWRMPRAALR